MSYDLHLFRVPPDLNPFDAYKQAFTKRNSIFAQGGKDQSAERVRLSNTLSRNKRLVSALILGVPSLSLFEPAKTQFANSPSDDHRQGHLYVDPELTDSVSGLQINLFKDTAAIAIPFWRQEEAKANKTLAAAWTCLRILESAGGFSSYDPQVGKVLNLDSDFGEVVQAYHGMLDSVNRALRTPQVP